MSPKSKLEEIDEGLPNPKNHSLSSELLMDGGQR
jgi:hypothetical protein